MYTYYEETQSEKHYLYADEVAELLWKNYGIGSPDGKRPATVLVRAFLVWLHSSEPKLYYSTKHGLKRVFPLADRAMAMLIEGTKEPGGTIEIKNKRYRYTRKSVKKKSSSF